MQFSCGDLPHDIVSGSVQSPPFLFARSDIPRFGFFFSYLSYKMRRHKPARTLLCAAARAVRAGARLAVRAEHKSLLEITVGGGRRGWSEILHESNTTVNLTEVSACLCCLEKYFLPKALKSHILVWSFFAKPSVLPGPSSLVMLLWSVLISCVGRSPQESSAALSPPFSYLLMSVQERCFHKSGLGVKYEALIAKYLGKGVSFSTSFGIFWSRVSLEISSRDFPAPPAFPIWFLEALGNYFS